MESTGGRDGGDPAVPDAVPDELVRDHGEEARRTVRTAGHGARTRAAAAALGDGEVWLVTVVVFVLGVGMLAAVAGLVFAAVNWPLTTLLVVVPTAALVAGSYLVARKLVEHERASEHPRPG